MRNLVYGCSQRIKGILSEMVINIGELDYADSNPKKWGEEIFSGKRIIQPSDIDVGAYSFCLVGSEIHQDEIWRQCVSIGFSEHAIIPASFVVSQHERDFKTYFIDVWKKVVEKRGINVIKEWYAKDDTMNCIICIEGGLWNDLEISTFSLLSDKLELRIENIVTGESAEYSCMRGDKVLWEIKNNKELLRLCLKNCAFDVPWVSLITKIGKLHTELYKQKRAVAFVERFETMSSFYFHDEDYLAIKGFDKGGTIIDLGANYGQSLYAFYYLTNSQIISVEAVPELYDVLQIFKEKFDVQQRVTIINTGISDQSSKLTWYEPGPLWSGGFDKDFLLSIGVCVPLEEKKLPCDSLDNIFPQNDDVWLVKIDLEGLEYKALQGGKNLIKRNFPIMCIEENQYKSKIVDLLREYYELYYYNMTEDRFVRSQVLGANYWMIPKAQYRSGVINEFLDRKGLK